jgi:hypothetical protein
MLKERSIKTRSLKSAGECPLTKFGMGFNTTSKVYVLFKPLSDGHSNADFYRNNII